MLEDSPNQFGEPAAGPVLPPRHARAKYAVSFGVALLVVALLVWIWFTAPPARGGAPIRCTIQEGSGAVQVGRQLQACGLVRSGWFFAVYARLTGNASHLQAGTYELPPTLTLGTVVREVASGNALSTDIEVTIPEGMNVWEVDAVLASASLISPGQLRSSFGHKEGHLFPDTYRFAKDATIDDIVVRLEQNFYEKAKTRSDITVITASILEKEAKTAEDMALVAGIIAKRIELGMPLQVDATVAYGWCLRVRGYARDCDVTQAPIATEIKVDGPYNTYARPGLPEAAISNPGVQAIIAAENPKASPYLYYLSTRDGSQLIYSKTLSEHLQNRRKYLGF